MSLGPYLKKLQKIGNGLILCFFKIIPISKSLNMPSWVSYFSKLSEPSWAELFHPKVRAKTELYRAKLRLRHISISLSNHAKSFNHKYMYTKFMKISMCALVMSAKRWQALLASVKVKLLAEVWHMTMTTPHKELSINADLILLEAVSSLKQKF